MVININDIVRYVDYFDNIKVGKVVKIEKDTCQNLYWVLNDGYKNRLNEYRIINIV